MSQLFVPQYYSYLIAFQFDVELDLTNFCYKVILARVYSIESSSTI